MSSTTRTMTLPSKAPATLGCYLGLVVASITLLYAINLIWTDSADMLVYKAAVSIAGTVQALCCLFALQRSRTAWSFGLALNGTMTVVFLFGAPRMRDALERLSWITDRIGDVPLALGFVPAVVFAAITALLAMSSDQY